MKMSDSLSQEEIDALMNGNGSKEGALKSQENESKAQDSKENEEKVEESSDDKNKELNPMVAAMDDQAKRDLIGEVGNISMSQAATTLSSILNHRVTITTPRVTKVTFSELIDGIKAPKVATTVKFKEGLVGANLMLLEVHDANVIANLMMGGDGTPENEDFTELELSAVAEAMNQMIGSAATSMATMINRKVDILPPEVNLWKEPNKVDYDFIVKDEVIYVISFSLNVDGLVQSEIMQIFTETMVNDIATAMLADKATVINNRKNNEKELAEESIETNTTVQPQKSESKNAIEKKVEINTPQFQELNPDTPNTGKGDNLELIMDIPLNLSVVLGRSKKAVRDILSFNTGSVIELDKLTDEPLEILLNGKLIATGEVVVINDNFGVRITDILSPKKRIDYMR